MNGFRLPDAVSRLGLIVLILLVPSCSRREVPVARCFDFFASLGSAEIRCRGVPVDPLNLNGGLQPYTEDARLYCPALPKASITFRAVPLAPGGEFKVGMGLSPGIPLPTEASKDGRVRFRVELILDNRRRDLVDRTLDVRDLIPGAMVEVRLPVDDEGGRRGDFIFHSDLTRGLERYRPMWCGAIYRSPGRNAEPEEIALHPPRRAFSLLDRADRIPMKRDLGSSFRADFDEITKTFRAQSTGRILMVSPPSSQVFEVPIPERGRLAFGIAVVANSTKERRSLRFAVRVDDAEVWSRTIEGTHEAVAHRAYLDLSAFAGKTKRIRLETGFVEAGNAGDVTALWIHPVMERLPPVSPRPADDGKNVVVVLVDALRADHCSLHGYERETTPNLDRWSRQGVVFENALAQSSWTIPSTATLLTGQYSYTHGLYDAYHWFLVPGIDTLPTRLREAGWTTGAFVANRLVSQDRNFARGFEGFHVMPFATAAQVNRAFLNWLDALEGRRFFAYLHYMEPHLPYAAPGSFLNRYEEDQERHDEPDPARSDEIVEALEDRIAERGCDLTPDEWADVRKLVNRYDGEIAYWDDRFGRLMKALETRGLLEDTLVVVTADHGEEFLDHGMLRHGHSLHDELLRVPLIFLNTGRDPKRRSDPAGLVDVAPTLMGLIGEAGLAGAEHPEVPMAGRDLFDARTKSVPLFAETAHGARRPGGKMMTLRGVTTWPWKGVLNLDEGSLAIWNRAEDPEEMEDTIGRPSRTRRRA